MEREQYVYSGREDGERTVCVQWEGGWRENSMCTVGGRMEREQYVYSGREDGERTVCVQWEGGWRENSMCTVGGRMEREQYVYSGREEGERTLSIVYTCMCTYSVVALYDNIIMLGAKCGFAPS